MNSFNNKTPACMYAKGFKLDKFLGNLQGYKIATGQVSEDEFRRISDKYGSDEGAVFGSLITNASGSYKNKGIQQEEQDMETRTRRKRRRRRRRDNSGKDDETVSAETAVPKLNSHLLLTDEPLTIPPALLDAFNDYGSSDDNSTKSDKDGNCSTTSNSETDDTDDQDFFGLSCKIKRSKSDQSTLKTSSEKPNKTSASIVSLNNQERMQTNHLNLPEKQQAIWDHAKLKYKDPVNPLSSYKCWKCRRVGHLPEDCTIKSRNLVTESASDVGQFRGGRSQQGNSKGSFYSSVLKDYYKRCQKLRNAKDAKCSDCGLRSNLAYCFECGLTLCDGRGHLINHLLEYPSHTKLFSYKLQRQIKCCKSTCEVVDCTELLMCPSCLGRAFTSHYSMINATWSRTGLKLIPNALACEQHFHWHRMNCANSAGEILVTREKLEKSRARGEGLLSEFYF